MITINDDDLPITVAEKIVRGTWENEIITILGKKKPDMFNVDDIKEIADYLMVYYNHYRGGDMREGEQE